MNLTTALKILDTYNHFPETRKQQITFLRERGYSSLRGGGLLLECKDEQVRAVVHRVMEEAEQVISEEVQYHRRQMASEEYWQSLYERFNIPEEQREDVSPAELEEMLLE